MDSLKRIVEPTALTAYSRQPRDYNPYAEQEGRSKPAEASEGRDFASILARMMTR